MQSSVDINGKKLLPIKAVASRVDYSRDYITRLAREKKIVATQVGGRWYVHLDSLLHYQDFAKTESEVKKRILSSERKRELAIKNSRERKDRLNSLKASKKPIAIFSTGFVAVAGLVLGVFLMPLLDKFSPDFSQTASVVFQDTQSKRISVSTDVPLQDFVSDRGNYFTPNFSSGFEQRQITADGGLLLLPLESVEDQVLGVDDFFSDPVTVNVDKHGRTRVFRIDGQGQRVGEGIPFVSVPVVNETSYE